MVSLREVNSLSIVGTVLSGLGQLSDHDEKSHYLNYGAPAIQNSYTLTMQVCVLFYIVIISFSQMYSVFVQCVHSNVHVFRTFVFESQKQY